MKNCMLECKDIKPVNSAGQPHGYWEVYYLNGTLRYKGNYLNGQAHGYWESYYYYYGNLAYKGNYLNGKPHGYWEVYNNDGTLDYNRYYARM